MQLARIYHGHTTGILTVVSKNPLPFFSFRFSSIFFYYGNGSCLSILCFCLVVVDCKSKNKQTNKQTEKIWILSVCKTLFSSATCSTPFVLFHSARQKTKRKKNVSLLCFILFKSEVTDYQRRMTGTVSNSLEIQQEMNEPWVQFIEVDLIRRKSWRRGTIYRRIRLDVRVH